MFVKILNFCLLFEFMDIIDPLLFSTTALVLTLTTISVTHTIKFFKEIFIMFSFLLKIILSFTFGSFEKIINIIVLIDYFLYIAGRVFKYSFLGILLVFNHCFITFLIIFIVKFAFNHIFYIHFTVFSNSDVMTYNFTFPLTFLAEDISNYGQEGNISVNSGTSENTKPLNDILRNYLLLTLVSFSVRMFYKNRILNFTKLFVSALIIFICFCKVPRDQIHSELKACSNFEFNTPESMKIQENLNKFNINTTLAYLRYQN